MLRHSPNSIVLTALRLDFSLGSVIGDHVVDLIAGDRVREPKSSVAKGVFRLPNSSYVSSCVNTCFSSFEL